MKNIAKHHKFSASALGSTMVMSLMLLTACASTAPLVTPHDFAGQSQVLPAANRSRLTGVLVDESFDLGPYRVTGVQGKGSSSANSTTINGVKTENKRSGFSYRLVGGPSGQTELIGRCESRSQERSSTPKFGMEQEQGRSLFSCVCNGGGSNSDGHESKLSIAGDQSVQGRSSSTSLSLAIHVDGQSYRVGRYGDRGQLIPADEPFHGYRVDGPQGAVAALGLNYPGTVWLHERLPAPQREVMTCAIAGLMLHRGPQ
ncbi:hypothetical protein LNV08_04515 [Paucibacter sp. TC2R-5]|uniref:hypothetical protein n=1 Tax=Paucibacter sp. TC2R-5 TaxID=2893555 RepID=UPI0021E490FF|nr:hypothetical protein [Paucibacter sp. TC2R-5]MCV2358231.1 hypothetical protein [Paucibacter sp. TC2R-5]